MKTRTTLTIVFETDDEVASRGFTFDIIRHVGHMQTSGEYDDVETLDIKIAEEVMQD